MVTFQDVCHVVLYFLMFSVSFYCLSGIDFSKIFLNHPNRAFKAQMLLLILSCAIGYLATRFILAITFQL